jgi:16S rRNA (guanine1207-N2)-methyltransferase
MAHKDPDFLAASVMAEVLESASFEGPVLIMGEPTGTLAQAIDTPNETWARRAGPAAEATPWPADGPFGTVLVRMTRSAEELKFVLALAAHRLMPGGKVFLFGANDEGIKSAAKAFAPRFETPDTLIAKRHCRVFGATLASTPSDDDLQGFAEAVGAETKTLQLAWTSWPGMFAHGRLDGGSAFLIENLPPLTDGARVLDYGCGAGVLSLALQRQAAGLEITLFDNDALALEVAAKNVEGAEIVCGTSLKDLDDETYDLILSNPPIHTGKQQTYAMLERLILEAPAHLAKGGRLRLVVQGTAPVERMMGQVFTSVTPVKDNRSFVIWEGVV